jgi:steroid delta-isomerase-like uncharacterized protein
MPATRLLALAGGLAAATAAAAGRTPSTENRSQPMHAHVDRNKEVVRSLYEVSLNTGNLDSLDRWIAPDFVGPRGDVGPAAFAATVVELRTAFPDIRYTVEDLVEEGDRVAIRWSWTGTHDGSFRGFAPTGKRISNPGFAIFHLRGGKIVRAWVDTDRLGFLQQIGAIPADLAARLQPGAPKARGPHRG